MQAYAVAQGPKGGHKSLRTLGAQPASGPLASRRVIG